jgi:radical SAM superfamily enzyme YgiQ (UPF0313 family)
MRKKVILLNPPSFPAVIRDYYCSHFAKGSYMWPPLDLLVMSGSLHGSFDCTVIDANVLKMDIERTIDEIKRHKPDLIISLVASVTWGPDMKFLKRIRSETGISALVVSGDYARSYPQKVLEENQFIDAIILDFTDCDIAGFLASPQKQTFRNILRRGEQAIFEEKKVFSYPIPRHELFPINKYHLHHLQYHPFTALLTTFGCMYNCTFCPFERIHFKRRELENIQEELKYLKFRRIREVLLLDQSFGSDREHAERVCEIMEKECGDLSWSCEMRVDAAREDLLLKMKKAGCHTLMFGVESADEEVLRKHNKRITVQQIRDAFSLAKRTGLRTLAHVMIGMDGENAGSQERLIKLCLELDPQYVSFNIAAPLWDTTFRDILESEKKIFNQKVEIDSSMGVPVWESGSLRTEEVLEWHRKAFRRFYYRPFYIFKYLLEARSAYRVKMMIKEGLNILFSKEKWDDKMRPGK